MMKNYIIILITILFAFACNQTPQAESASTQEVTADKNNNANTSISADSTEIATVIHGFYKWYDGFVNKNMTFTDDTGKHLKLSPTKLAAYYAEFKKTGFVSEEFVENEYAFFKKCEKLWENENKDEVVSCLDADKYFCGQDWEINFWVNSPIRIKKIAENKAFVTMYSTDKENPQERNFELKKENNKWLLTKIACDMGIQ